MCGPSKHTLGIFAHKIRQMRFVGIELRMNQEWGGGLKQTIDFRHEANVMLVTWQKKTGAETWQKF